MKSDVVLSNIDMKGTQPAAKSAGESGEARKYWRLLEPIHEAIGANTAATVCVASVACGCELMSSCDFCLMTLGLLTMTVGGNC